MFDICPSLFPMPRGYCPRLGEREREREGERERERESGRESICFAFLQLAYFLVIL
jgi:hypothetical protein